jgi:hypothetical protein
LPRRFAEQEVKDAEASTPAEEGDRPQTASTQQAIDANEADVQPAAEGQAQAGADADGRYPERSPITGGWYGGEIGLQQFIEVRLPALHRDEKDIREAVAAGPGTKKLRFQGREITARVIGEDGGDPIYIGFDKK